MKRETLFLKIVIFLIGIPVLGLSIFWLPWIANIAADINPELVYTKYLFLMSIYATAIPFFVALYQGFKLLSYIDKNIAFSELSVNSLKTIKYCAITISILYVVGMPLFILMAQADDAPGIVALGLVITFASIVIAAFAAILQKLLKNAVDLKSENDLTI